MSSSQLRYQPPFRIGYGFDLHATQPGNAITLGGTEIPAEFSLKGHSDADALLHAITDALLGALALRDIGYHFPDDAADWEDADSARFLQYAQQLVHSNGYHIGNLDATIVAEAPKLNPHIPAMQARIAVLLEIAPEQVSLKATTHEKLGPLGAKEGIAVHCAALVVKDPPAEAD